MDTLNRVRVTISSLTGADEAAILPETHLEDDLEMDSLDKVELLAALEEEFRQNIPDEEAEKMLNVGDIVNYINSKGE